MRRGLDWHQREQRAILDAIRAARMTDRQAAIFNIVLDLIYDGAGETPDDPKHIASYLSNVGAAAARTAIQQLIDMGKIYRVGDMLHQKRAENEAKAKRNLSETRSEIGRLGGISSAFSRAKAKENNNLTEAIASSKPQAEKSREEYKEWIDDNASAKSEILPDDPTNRELLLAAMGLTSGVTATGRVICNPSDMIWSDRWRDELGLSIAEQCAVIRDVVQRVGRTPNTLKYFTQEMQRRSGELNAPPLTAINDTRGNDGYQQRRMATGDAASTSALRAIFTAAGKG